MSHIQSIFRDHAAGYEKLFGHKLTDGQRKVLHAVRDCRSGACGHHVFECPECGQTHLANSSCGNRHCPICQNEKAAEWVYRRQLDILPCVYFMATFTLPEAMRAVALRHPAEVYGALLDEAAAALRTLEADSRFVGCRVSGFFGALHTCEWANFRASTISSGWSGADVHFMIYTTKTRSFEDEKVY